MYDKEGVEMPNYGANAATHTSVGDSGGKLEGGVMSRETYLEKQLKYANEELRRERRHRNLERRVSALQLAIGSFNEKLSEQTGEAIVTRATTFDRFLENGAS